MNTHSFTCYSFKEMEDEDLIMEENEEEEEEEERYNSSRGKALYPEEFMEALRGSREGVLGTFSPKSTRYDSPLANPLLQDWTDGIDEKGDSVGLLMHQEKSIVHQKFFNSK